MSRTILVLVALVGLGACDKAATESDNPPPAKKTTALALIPADAPPAEWGKCASCHSIEPGQQKLGPSLAGVLGRKAGSEPGYNYSTAMKGSGLLWNEATLDRYIASPRETVPGNKMIFGGLPDSRQRETIIAYLKTI